MLRRDEPASGRRAVPLSVQPFHIVACLIEALQSVLDVHGCLLAPILAKALAAMGCAASTPAVVEPTAPTTPGGGLSRKVNDDPDSTEALARETFCEYSEEVQVAV